MLQLWFYIIVIGLGGFLLIMISFGEIGPQRLKDRMRRFSKWTMYDAAPFFPIDPNKPFTEALKESTDNALPTRARLKNALLLWVIAWGAGIVLGIIVVAFL